MRCSEYGKCVGIVHAAQRHLKKGQLLQLKSCIAVRAIAAGGSMLKIEPHYAHKVIGLGE